MQMCMALLLSVFLLLSFCPVRKSLYSLINGNPNPTENNTAGINKGILPPSEQSKTDFDCTAKTNITFRNIDFTTKSGFSFIPAILGLALLLTAFSVSSGFYKIFLPLLPDRHLKAAPLYILNRILLI